MATLGIMRGHVKNNVMYTIFYFLYDYDKVLPQWTGVNNYFKFLSLSLGWSFWNYIRMFFSYSSIHIVSDIKMNTIKFLKSLIVKHDMK